MTHVQWTAKRTMNIMRRRMTMEPMLELAKSLVWWAGSIELDVDFELALDLAYNNYREISTSLRLGGGGC